MLCRACEGVKGLCRSTACEARDSHPVTGIIAVLDTAGVRRLLRVPQQRAHLMPERTEVIFELCCLGKLLCGEYVAHLKHDLASDLTPLRLQP